MPEKPFEIPRPFEDLRPFGPLIDLDDAEPVAEIKEGPIWTWVEVTTFAGSREESTDVTQEHINFVDNEVTKLFTSEEAKERLEFAGELNDFDIFTFKSSDLTISSYIRHSEDFISIPILNEFIDPLQAQINSHKDLTVRDYRITTPEFVEETM